MIEMVIEQFNGRVVDWARSAFAEELRTGFRRSQTFDSFRTRRDLAILGERPRKQLELLAWVLPLQLLSNTPEVIERRNRLTAEEKEAVEQLCADYKTDHEEQFPLHVANIARRRDNEIKEQFNAASRKGNQIIKDIASEWKCDSVGAARGEWGLIFVRDGLRMVVSLKLARNMDLAYDLSLSDQTGAHSIRFHDHYLGVLGVSYGSWFVENAGQFPDKLLAASEFAIWHKREYDKIIEQVHGKQ
jgi:hypothetical protein